MSIDEATTDSAEEYAVVGRVIRSGLTVSVYKEIDAESVLSQIHHYFTPLLCPKYKHHQQ